MRKALKLLAGLLLGIPALPTHAQNPPAHIPRCGYELVWKNLERKHPDFRKKYDALIMDKNSGQAARPTGVIYRIPVVFHVVYYKNGNVEKGNIADSLIQHQVTILNDAFRKRHNDTGNLRTQFKPISADAEIEFYLATKDPSGAATNGITRNTTTIDGFGEPSLIDMMSSLERIKHTNQGGFDGWPSDKYLNIWVADMTMNVGSSGFIAVLGYATPPLNPLPPNWGTDTTELSGMKDGVVLQYHCIGGSKNPGNSEVAPMSTSGRTAVHEVGHYLGLRHIWGDAQDELVACTPAASDGIDDTPDQAMQSYGQPSPAQNTCHENDPGDLPDLWENYMDYSDDQYVVMFTEGQVALMRRILANQRKDLVNQNGTGFADKDTRRNMLNVYPQPASQRLNIAFEGKVEQIVMTDVLGKMVKTVQASKTLDVSNLPSGMYFLKLQSGQHFYTQRIVVQH